MHSITSEKLARLFTLFGYTQTSETRNELHFKHPQTGLELTLDRNDKDLQASLRQLHIFHVLKAKHASTLKDLFGKLTYTYSPTVDAMYFYLPATGKIAKTIEVEPARTLVDLNSAGEILGIEVLDFSLPVDLLKASKAGSITAEALAALQNAQRLRVPQGTAKATLPKSYDGSFTSLLERPVLRLAPAS